MNGVSGHSYEIVMNGVSGHSYEIVMNEVSGAFLRNSYEM